MPVGQFCTQLITANEKECARSVNGVTKECSPVWYDMDSFNEAEKEFFTLPGEDPEEIKK